MTKQKNLPPATSSISGQTATITTNRMDICAIGRRPGVSRRGFFNAALTTTATAVAARTLSAEETPQVGAGAPPPKIKDEYKPGDRAPVSGVYRVIHDKLDGDDHALSHEVTAIAGTAFPPCRLCAGEVRFRLYRAAEPVGTNSHFKQ